VVLKDEEIACGMDSTVQRYQVGGEVPVRSCGSVSGPAVPKVFQSAMVDDLDQFENPSSRSLADYWAMAVRRRWVILLPLFLCWALVWIVSWFLPAVYKSEAVILVEQPKVPEQYVVPNVTVNLQDRLQSMTQQILSRTRLQATIDRFHLYQGSRTLGGLTQTGDPVEQMRKDIKIDLVDSAARPGQLTGFKIAYSAGSPELAQRVNTELTSLFIEENLKYEQQLSESTTSFLQSQLEDARNKLAEQEAKVRAFKATHFGDLPSQMETNVQILSGLQNQLLSTQRALDGAKQQKLYLESLLQQYQSAQATVGSVDSATASLESVTNELVDLRAKLEDARARLTDEHPDVIALKEKVANTEKRKKDLEAEIAAHPDSGNTKNGMDPTATAEVQRRATTPMMQVQSQIKSINLEIENDNEHVKDLESQISSYRARLNLTPQTEQQLADISRGYEESKANYNSLLQKQNQSQLATSLEQRQQGQQFRILDPPNLPNRPSAPNHLLLSLAGLLAGGGLGLGLAAYLELRNALVRQEKDLDGLIPARVLVGIPHLKVPGEDRVQAMTRRLEIGAFAVMVLLLLAGNLYALYKG
jgi:polysaccharide biosynthesis transport protein